MQCISIDDNVKLNNTIVTIGKFDGIHKGHEKLFEQLRENANGRQKVVLTFETSPKAFLDDNANKTIVTESEKQMLCDIQGIDVYMKMPMKKEFLALTPDEFVSKILKEKIGATTIVCGPDFRFGTKASGDVNFLKENQNIRIIRLCLDNDGPGRVASSVLKDKYESRGYKVIDLPPPKAYKDYNDWIKSLRSKKTITMEKYR